MSHLNDKPQTITGHPGEWDFQCADQMFTLSQE